MNPKIRKISYEYLSRNWYVLKKYTYDFLNRDGEWTTQHREVYDRGDGAAILLYNLEMKTVVLTRQFRLPTYVNGNEDGYLLEACAGLLDKDSPQECIIKETREETGYVITKAEKLYEAYMSPGSVTEILHFFIAAYEPKDKQFDGGGLEEENEEIEVVELSFIQAKGMLRRNEIRDAKTIMLLQSFFMRLG